MTARELVTPFQRHKLLKSVTMTGWPAGRPLGANTDFFHIYM